MSFDFIPDYPTEIIYSQEELVKFIEENKNCNKICINFKDATFPHRSDKKISIVLEDGATIRAISGAYKIFCNRNNIIHYISGGEVVLQNNCKVRAINNTIIDVDGNNCEIYASIGCLVDFQDFGNECYVYLEENASVRDANNSVIIANDKSTVENSNNCVIKLRDFSMAYGFNYKFYRNTFFAYNNSKVQVDYLDDNKFIGFHNSTFYFFEELHSKENLELYDNSKWVCLSAINPLDRLKEFFESREISVDENGDFRLFKAVHKNNGTYTSDFDETFIYKIGQIVEPKELCNTDFYEECGSGIHIAPLDWVKIYGSTWSDLAILELEANIKDVILPYCSNGKMRVKKAKVIREVKV